MYATDYKGVNSSSVRSYSTGSSSETLDLLNRLINGVDPSNAYDPSDPHGVIRQSVFGTPVTVYPETVKPGRWTPSASSPGIVSSSSNSALSEAPVNNSNYSNSVGVVDNVVQHLGASTEDMTVNNSTSAGDPNNAIKTEERDYYYRAFMDYLDAMQQSWKAANEEQRANWERAARWNEHMYDTRYQRTVADLKKAGINPLLIGGALSSQGSVSMSAAAGFSPSMPSTPYTSTSSSEISGMFNLYSTLINMTSNERVAFLQNKTKNREIDKSYANNFVYTLGRLLGSSLTAFAMA